MQLSAKKPARAGLIGNPSDGYGTARRCRWWCATFAAEVTLYEWDRIEVVFSQNDQNPVRFGSTSWSSDVRLARLLRRHPAGQGHDQEVRRVLPPPGSSAARPKLLGPLPQRTSPASVGMAGSSAIIVATLRCLMEFYEVEIPLEAQPSLVLSVETEELGIAAGLQDRVVQTYEGLVYMDFARERMRDLCELPCGVYEPLDPGRLPPLYVAYSTSAGQPTEVTHNNLRARFNTGEQAVIEAMARLAELTDQAREAILAGDAERLGQSIDANFELRRSICRLPPGQVKMVERARAAGATAKFAGSGGAIIGTYPDAATFARLQSELEAIGCRVLRPVVVPDRRDAGSNGGAGS